MYLKRSEMKDQQKMRARSKGRGMIKQIHSERRGGERKDG